MGTEWTAPGAGATMAELMTAARSAGLMPSAACRPVDVRTQLRLTGAPLESYDVVRIAKAWAFVAPDVAAREYERRNDA